MDNLSQKQLIFINRYGLAVRDVIDGVAVCEVSHPNGVVDVYVKPDGAVHVEEGDDLDGYEMIPLADSFLAGILSD